ncbi:DUF4058 family protein [Oscillatoria salina]|uniref:DUF4058 family protein n=1 Tax=Oscillatoria salina TaxID=331517 RepID=UPI001CD00F8F|nr:DUF4058 family protein [Oscillatoria salina]MBZ8178770.1 DUF4058 family protein [Oscillatoria salina IIICB1]
MPSPFPGMNPYLENPATWSDVHNRLINNLANSLSSKLRPKYYIAVEERIYETSGEESTLIGISDDLVIQTQTNKSINSNLAVVNPTTKPITVKVPLTLTQKEAYLEIREVATRQVITTIEILSPKNKASGEGRQKYETKRQKIFASLTNLVEIDLLRQGRYLPFYGTEVASDYRILISRSNTRPNADLYAFNLPEKIPSFPLPLRSEDVEPVVELSKLVDEVYDLGSFDLRIDYSRPPVPSLSAEYSVWANDLLQKQGLR